MRPCDTVCSPVCGSLEGTDCVPLLGSFSVYCGGSACFDEKQEKALPLFRRPGGHICPQCGQNGDSPLTLFRRGEIGIDADSRKSRKTRAFPDAIHEKGPIHANGKQ